MRLRRAAFGAVASLAVAALLATRLGGQCPVEPVLRNYTGGASAVCQVRVD